MDKSLLSLFSELKEKDSSRQGIVVGEGRFVVQRMAASSLELLGAVTTEENSQGIQSLLDGRCPVQVLSQKEISQIAGYPFHRGVLAAAREPEPILLADYLSTAAKPGLLVVLPDPNIPENIGAICRSSAALGASGLLLPPSGPSPYGRRVLRTSMGTILSLPVIILSGNPNEDSRQLKQHGYTLTGAALQQNSLEPHQLVFRAKRVLAFGNEAFGLSEMWLKNCDETVKIVMDRQTDSLNVGAAAAILLHHLRSLRN